MRIDLPCCSLKSCRYCFDGNCTSKIEFERCEFMELKKAAGNDYDPARLRDLVQADRNGRCVVIPFGGFDDKDGENALKSAMHTVFYHNNPVTRYIADAVAEKLVREAAEEAMKGEKHG